MIPALGLLALVGSAALLVRGGGAPPTGGGSSAPGGSSTSSLRARLCALAASFEGVGMGTDPNRYLALIMGPADGPERREYFATRSGCGLVARGLLRLAGCSSAILAAPYRDGHAIADLQEIAEAAGGWVPAFQRGDRLPKAGDVVILASATGGHAYTLVSGGGLLGEALESIDGGQKDGLGQQKIGRCQRQLSMEGGVLVDRDRFGNARSVHGWLDVDRLPWG